MATIFLSIYDGDTEKNILRTGVLSMLKKAGHTVVLLVRSKERIGYYTEQFADEQVHVELLPYALSKAEKIFHHLGWNSIPTYSVFLRRHDMFLSHKRKIRYAIERTCGFLGRFRVWRELIRCVYYMMPDSYASDIFKKYKPDVLFSPSMFSAEDFRLARYAKKHGVKTVTTVKSWDVLTTKAFTRVKADLLLVFNEYNKQEAIDIGDYNADAIRICGFPQFDAYSDPSVYVTKEEFFKEIGADLSKKLILFAVPGDWKNPYTHEVMIGLNDAIEQGRFSHPVQVLARFHPKYPATGESLKNLNHFIMDRPGKYFGAGTERSLDTSVSATLQWTFTNKDLIHLANSLKHSDVTVNTESTMTLDAAAIDKPVVLVGFDGFHKLDYWHSMIRNYDRDHYVNVTKTGGVKIAKSLDELVSYIDGYLKNPSLDAGGRRELQDKLLYKLDGRSAERVAKAVLSVVE